MSEWVAPAKLNLSLEVAGADSGGMHPLRSLVQTIEWTDTLIFEASDVDRLHVEGADLGDPDDNLVWKAIDALVERRLRPRLDIRLVKRVAVAAGLGGGSADAAATLMAVADLLGIDLSTCRQVAPTIGADVPLFLDGGTAWLEGYGQILDPVKPLEGFAVTVVVPPFSLSTKDVYRTWDKLEGPRGPVVEGRKMPPAIRRLGPLRNDLTPAAIHMVPELADWLADLARLWERPVMMSGSGPSAFGYFSDEDEATSAGRVAPTSSRSVQAAGLRRIGVAEA